MKITPIKEVKFTIAKLSVEELGFLGFLFIVFGLIHSISKLTGSDSKLPIISFFIVAPILIAFFISIKGREQNFLAVWWQNRNIPDNLEGTHSHFSAVTKTRSNEKIPSS